MWWFKSGASHSSGTRTLSIVKGSLRFVLITTRVSLIPSASLWSASRRFRSQSASFPQGSYQNVGFGDSLPFLSEVKTSNIWVFKNI